MPRCHLFAKYGSSLLALGRIYSHPVHCHDELSPLWRKILCQVEMKKNRELGDGVSTLQPVCATPPLHDSLPQLFTTEVSGCITKSNKLKTLKSELKRWIVKENQNLEKWPKSWWISQVFKLHLILFYSGSFVLGWDPLAEFHRQPQSSRQRGEQLHLQIIPCLSGWPWKGPRRPQ